MRKWLAPIVAALSVGIVLPTLAGAASRKCSLNLAFLTRTGRRHRQPAAERNRDARRNR